MGNICGSDDNTKNQANTSGTATEPTGHNNQLTTAAATMKMKISKKLEEIVPEDLSSDDDDTEDILAQEVVEKDSGDHKTQEIQPAKPDAPKVKTHFRTIKATVSNVYDGDTLTLLDAEKYDDRTRVRFVFIDAPEVKDKEAFAQESKKLVKQLCDKKDIEVEVDTREEKDRFGRLIGRVFVTKENGKRINVNAKVLSMGLACYYRPSHSRAFVELEDKMLALQNAALKARIGIWSDFQDYEVYKTRNGNSFHKNDCEHVSKFHLEKLNKSECLAKGMSSCRTCHA